MGCFLFGFFVVALVGCFIWLWFFVLVFFGIFLFMAAWSYIMLAIQANYLLAALRTDDQSVLLKIQGYLHIW